MPDVRKNARRLLLIILGGVVVILFAVVGVRAIQVAFAEDLSPKKGTLDYYLAINSVLRRFPMPSLVGEARYYSTCGDGCKLPAAEVSFRTATQAADLMAEVGGYLSKRGFHKDTNAMDQGATFVRENKVLTVTLTPLKDELLQVTAVLREK